MKKWWWNKEKDSEEKLKRIALFSDFYQNLEINKDVPTAGVFRSFSEYSTPIKELEDSFPQKLSITDFPLYGSKTFPRDASANNSFRKSAPPQTQITHDLDTQKLDPPTSPRSDEEIFLRRLKGDNDPFTADPPLSKDSDSNLRPLSNDSSLLILPSVAGMALPEPEQLDDDLHASYGGEGQLEETAEIGSVGERSLEERMGLRGGSSGTKGSILSAATLQVSDGGAGFDWSLVGVPNGDAGGVQATVTTMDSTATLISNSSKSKSKFQFYFWWTLNTDAFLVAISLAMGLGNLLRLPRMAALNGGGIFMIVYICITLLIGIPLIFLEIGLGQFCQQGTMKIWQAVPLFKGVGFVKVLASLLMSIYYPMLMTISLFYFIWSAKEQIPFDDCPIKKKEMFTNLISQVGGYGEECLNNTILTPNQTDGPWFGVYIAFIFLIWSVFCLCLFKSVSSYRLAIYILLLPTIMGVIAVLVNATRMTDSYKGIQLLTHIQWDKLLNAEVWYFATIQMFFSTHAGLGNIVTCAGKMYSKSNAFWIAVSYVLLNLIMGIIFVITVYLWIGKTYNSTSEINLQMPEIFVLNLIYDTSFQHPTNVSSLWAALAYLTLLLGGFISMVALLFSAILSLVQESERKIKWWHIVLAMCGVGFTLGVLFVLRPNLEILHMLDHYVIGRMVIASTILELIGFGWIYGGETLYKDFEFVLGQKLNVVWKYLWIITPVFLLAMEILSLVKMPLDHLGNKEDHVWTYSIGWSIYLTTWFIVISTAVRQINNQVDYNFTDKFLSSLKPSIDWGPVDPICRHRWKQWGDQYSLTGRRDFTLSRRGTRDYTHSVRANSSPIIITPSVIESSQPTSSSENDTDNNSSEPFTLNVQNGSCSNSSSGPFTLQSNGTIGGRQMPKGRYWRAIH